MSRSSRCACHAERPLSEPRRRVIRIAAAGVAASLALSPPAALSQPVRGDRLVEDDADGPPTPLKASDLRPGKPLLAFPFDAATRTVRNASRLNKVVLMRFPESELSAEAKSRAAGGVVAFSAICTHQACDVKTWLSKEKVLVCFCHASKFALLDGGTVSGGPATRALPWLPLALEGDTLVIAGAFSGALGGSSS
jgi:rieske iron-sulfur protein